MLRWFSRAKAQEGWLAVSIGAQSLCYAQGRRVQNGKSAIARCGTLALENEDAHRAAKEAGLARMPCSTLLAPGEYQVLLVEAPNVPQHELKTAVRWRVKDLIDYHLEDATIDVLDIPPDPEGAARGHWMYAIAARNEVIRACIARFETADIGLEVIEIEETAQRNIAALYERPNRGVALLYLGEASALLTVNFGGELYSARRIEVRMDHVLSAAEGAREELFGRVALEVQRTFDHFDRQFPFVPIERLLLGPEPRPTGLAEYLASSIGLPVERVRLGEVLAFDAGAAPDAQSEWRLFHLLGAALRHEAKVL